MISTAGTIVGTTSGSFFQSSIGGSGEINRIIAPTAGLKINLPIIFNDSIGGLEAGRAYYISAIVSSVGSSYFSVSETIGGPIAKVTTSNTVTNFVAIDIENISPPAKIISDAEFFQLDYGDYAERISTALETISTTLSSINTKLEAANTTSTEIKNIQARFKDLAEGKNDGIRVLGPWEWLGISSIVKSYADQGVNLASLKAQVDKTPKS